MGVAKIKKTDYTTCLFGRRTTGARIQYKEHEWDNPLKNSLAVSFYKLNVYLLYYSAIPLLDIFFKRSKSIYSHNDLCMNIHTVSCLWSPNTESNAECPSSGEGINKLW